jgi:hypothetical protein
MEAGNAAGTIIYGAFGLAPSTRSILEQIKNIAKEEITEEEPGARKNRSASTTFPALIFWQLRRVFPPLAARCFSNATP